MKSSLLIPYSLLRRRGSILCPKLGQKKNKSEPSCRPSHADCHSLQAGARLPYSGAILIYWFIQRENSFRSRAEVNLPQIASGRAINTLAEEVGSPHLVPGKNNTFPCVSAQPSPLVWVSWPLGLALSLQTGWQVSQYLLPLRFGEWYLSCESSCFQSFYGFALTCGLKCHKLKLNF